MFQNELSDERKEEDEKIEGKEERKIDKKEKFEKKAD